MNRLIRRSQTFISNISTLFYRYHMLSKCHTCSWNGNVHYITWEFVTRLEAYPSHFSLYFRRDYDQFFCNSWDDRIPIRQQPRWDAPQLHDCRHINRSYSPVYDRFLSRSAAPKPYGPWLFCRRYCTTLSGSPGRPHDTQIETWAAASAFNLIGYFSRQT